MGYRLVFINWDSAAPKTRLWDLAYTAQMFVFSDVSIPPAKAAQSHVAFVDGYEATRPLRRIYVLPCTHRRPVLITIPTRHTVPSNQF